MKFIEEQDVPERVRLMTPSPTKALESILRSVTTILEREPAQSDPLDLTPLVEAIRHLALPAHPPSPARSWSFEIVRDDQGQISDVVATRQD